MILTDLQAQQRDEHRKRSYLEFLQARRSEYLLLADGPDLSDLLRLCVEELPGHARALVFDFYRERKSVGEVARAQGKGAGAVKTSLFRVRQVLRKCVESKRR